MNLTVVSEDNYETVALAYVNSRRNEAPASTIRRIASIRRFALWAWKKPVFIDYKAPTPSESNPHPLPGRMDDIQLMLNVCHTIDETALITLQGMFALRVSEARATLPSHFELERNNLRVRGKGDKVRLLPYSDDTFELLGVPWARSEADGAGLCRYSDSGARDAIKRVAVRAGITSEVSSHDLRATRLTDLYSRTLDIELVRRFAGHADVKQTQIYIKVCDDKLRKAVA